MYEADYFFRKRREDFFLMKDFIKKTIWLHDSTGKKKTKVTMTDDNIKIETRGKWDEKDPREITKITK